MYVFSGADSEITKGSEGYLIGVGREDCTGPIAEVPFVSICLASIALSLFIPLFNVPLKLLPTLLRVSHLTTFYQVLIQPWSHRDPCLLIIYSGKVIFLFWCLSTIQKPNIKPFPLPFYNLPELPSSNLQYLSKLNLLTRTLFSGFYLFYLFPFFFFFHY